MPCCVYCAPFRYCTDRIISVMVELTYGHGGDLRVQIQHSVAVSVHQVIPPALLVVAEEINRADIL